MNEYLDLSEARQIENEHERIFAVAVLLGLPEIWLQHGCTISAKSGGMGRETVVDFVLENRHGEELYIEVTAGNKNSHRKRRQRKTVNLAGEGQNYVIVHGRDIDELRDEDAPNLREKVIGVLRGRFNGRLFSLQ